MGSEVARPDRWGARDAGDIEARKLRRIATFLRVYGVLSFVIFGPLMIGFFVQTPLLADPSPAAPAGQLNWLIWNGVVCGGEPCHVPPMLFIIYLAWAVFFFLAAGNPTAYVSFLDFTMWANLFHGLLMAVQALMHMERYWSKWFTDIPFVLILSLGIYLWRPNSKQDLR